jgi:hypothetical protein
MGCAYMDMRGPAPSPIPTRLPLKPYLMKGGLCVGGCAGITQVVKEVIHAQAMGESVLAAAAVVAHVGQEEEGEGGLHCSTKHTCRHKSVSGKRGKSTGSRQGRVTCDAAESNEACLAGERGGSRGAESKRLQCE